MTLRAETAEQRFAIYSRLRTRNRLVSILRVALPVAGALVFLVFVAQLLLASLANNFGIGKISFTGSSVVVDTPSYSGVMANGDIYKVSAEGAQAAVANLNVIELKNAALQLTNFWQDLKVDFDRGRIYLPAEEIRGHGAEEGDLAAGRITQPWRAAMAAAVARTRALFLTGRPLCGAVAGRLKHELRATWLGGMRVLSRIERVDFDVVARRPSLGAADAPWLAWKLVTWTGQP